MKHCFLIISEDEIDYDKAPPEVELAKARKIAEKQAEVFPGTPVHVFQLAATVTAKVTKEWDD